MDFDKSKNVLLNSHKTGVENNENSDFQNLFYAWYQDKGFNNNIRAQIREQLIKYLKDSPLWVSNTNTSSPKMQAFNLLIADFLMNQNNLFTLSVLITEVPFLANLCEFSSYVNHLGSNIQNRPIKKPNFQLNVVWDILESLGFQPNSDVTELTCQYYFTNETNQIHSLFACLFKAIAVIRNNHSDYGKVQCNTHWPNKSKNVECDTNHKYRLKNSLENVEDILRSFNLNEEQTNTMNKLLKKYQQNNNILESTKYEEHFKKLKEKNKELLKKVEDLEQMSAIHLHSCNSSLLLQKKHIDEVAQQLRLEKQQLHQSIKMFEEETKSTKEKLNKVEEENNKKSQDIENQKYALRLKEMEILKFKEETNKHINMNESNQIIILQEQNIELVKQLQEIKIKLLELESLKNVEQTNFKKIDNDLQRIELSLDNEMTRKLQKENDELRKFIKTQQQRIEELSKKVSNCTKQIQKAHQIYPTITDYQTRNVKKKIHFVDDSNKKKSYRTNQNISSTTTDYSTTVFESDNLTEDDIIKKAHSRLKILEMNTSKAEKNFQTNHMHHYNDRVFRVSNKKSYSDIRSNLSDDSDFGTLKSNRNKINLKELADKIGYHRSIRRSINLSQSENDLSPEMLRNHRFKNYTKVSNISPIKTLSSNMNNIHKTSPINITSPIINSPSNRENQNHTEFIDRSNISLNQLPKENQSQMKSVVINKSTNSNLQDVDNIENRIQTEVNTNAEINKNNSINGNNGKNYYNIDLQTLNNSEDNDLLHNQINLQHGSFNKVDISLSKQKQESDQTSINKKEQESDQSISFGSNKTDKSSDFWAL